MNKADVVVGLAWGDEAKGKVSSFLASKKDGKNNSYYSMVARWAGGNNAGHTVVIDGTSYKTHLVPSGVFHGIKSVIGPGCVLHPESFYGELKYLSDNGFDTSLVKVSPRCHIVNDDHITFDKSNLAGKLGTTSRGIAPTYASKAARTGVLARSVLSKDLLWDEKLSGNILCEGAQGVWLDLDAGNYPYVTSSTTLPYGACSLGFPAHKIDEVWGAAKIYDTRSGIDSYFPESLYDDPDLNLIIEHGKEYGVTTGRKRKVNWLNLDMLIRAINITGTTNLIVSKCDILEEVGIYRLFYRNDLISFSNLSEMKLFISERIEVGTKSFGKPVLKKVTFSHSPERV